MFEIAVDECAHIAARELGGPVHPRRAQAEIGDQERRRLFIVKLAEQFAVTRDLG